VAHVALGPAMRRGALDKGGAEAVGGVVVVRYGENPLQTIKNVKKKIEEIAPGLPKKTLEDGRISQVEIVPFYDRTGLINETLGTLNTALIDEILVTIIVVLFLVMHLRSSLLISGLLPLTVLMVFIAMKVFKVDANIVALSGIAIAIGTIVDMGIVITENILKHLDRAPPGSNRRSIIFTAATEVGGAVLTAVATTVVSFLPVFALEAAEGKLFKPLAYTKTFALIAAIIVALTVIPPFAHLLFFKGRSLFRSKPRVPSITNYLIMAVLAWLLASHWLPLGVGAEPLDRPAQARFQRCPWFPSEELLGRRRIETTARDITGLGCREVRLKRASHDLADVAVEVDHRGLPAGSDVQIAPTTSIRSSNARIRDILDEYVVA